MRFWRAGKLIFYYDYAEELGSKTRPRKMKRRRRERMKRRAEVLDLFTENDEEHHSFEMDSSGMNL